MFSQSITHAPVIKTNISYLDDEKDTQKSSHYDQCLELCQKINPPKIFSVYIYCPVAYVIIYHQSSKYVVDLQQNYSLYFV
jgi:hypothetical protein